MKPWVEHIRRNFSGDERFMMQSAYYKIEHYNPISALKEAGPLLLQIPFFIAAYRYISTLPVLENASFGAIQNLQEPDRLVSAAGISVNVLPIVMTIINIFSGMIYSKDGPVRQKIQIYGTAVLFLVLLYNSPSGLVIYWIMNNLFSLAKNIYFAHEPKNKRLLPTVASVFIILVISVGMIAGKIDTNVDIFLAEFILAYAFVNIVVTILQLYHIRIPVVFQCSAPDNDNAGKQSLSRILIPELVLTMLFGFYIPSTVIASSPVEFADSTTGLLRSELLLYPALVYAGLFMIWTSVLILSRDGKKCDVMTMMLWCLVGIAVVNQFLFPAKTGTLYTDLSFDGELVFPTWIIILNILCCLLACGILWFLYSKKKKLLVRAGAVVSAALFVLSFFNFSYITGKVTSSNNKKTETVTETKPITLSKTGTNVVVMMLDRAIGGYVPFIFDEIPELKEAYRGFVFYPNTISFGTRTNFGSPGLFGGYEYTPYESNKRDTVFLKDKQNEALKLMPKLFLDNGYHVTVCDPPCANYKYIPDLSIFDDLPGVHAYNLTGKFSGRFKTRLKGDPVARQKRNFLMYSIFRASPLFLKTIVYGNGDYMSIYMAGNHYTDRMIDAYSVLACLPEITEIENAENSCFLMFQNETPHNPTVLEPPDYALINQTEKYEDKYINRSLDGRTLLIENQRQWGHYCINVATYKAVASWLDYLREQGVYDNTRIILVADHGYYLRQFEDLIHPDGLDVESLNPLLMVKDFNAAEEWTVSNNFMTNADVPVLAMQGVIDNPVNPFTGQEINDNLKKKGTLIVTDSDNWKMEVNNGTTFDLGNGHWWSVHDSIFDMNNWEKLEEVTK